MSDYHITAEYPEGATDAEVMKIRAEAFRLALLHAATDPVMRAKMLAAEREAKARLTEGPKIENHTGQEQ